MATAHNIKNLASMKYARLSNTYDTEKCIEIYRNNEQTYQATNMHELHANYSMYQTEKGREP